MKSFLALFLSLIVAGSSLAQGRHGGSHGHGSGRSSGNHYIHRSHGGSHHHHGGHGHYGHGYSNGWWGIGYGSYPGYVYLSRDVYGPYGYSGYGYGSAVYGRPNYAGSGLFWGALAGAVIGNNSGDLGHDSWRGAAYGAAAGLLIGSIAENNARRREATASSQISPSVHASAQGVSTTPAAPVATEAVTAPKPRASSSMSSANGLFGR